MVNSNNTQKLTNFHDIVSRYFSDSLNYHKDMNEPFHLYFQLDPKIIELPKEAYVDYNNKIVYAILHNWTLEQAEFNGTNVNLILVYDNEEYEFSYNVLSTVNFSDYPNFAEVNKIDDKAQYKKSRESFKKISGKDL